MEGTTEMKFKKKKKKKKKKLGEKTQGDFFSIQQQSDRGTNENRSRICSL
jgi:hypothetical protein